MTRALLLLLLLSPLFASEELPRKVLAIYDSKVEKEVRSTFAHLICEFPLNYLGIDLIYHDLQEPLPDLSKRPDILAVLTCFPHENRMEDPENYLKWAAKTVDDGKKFLILMDPGFKIDKKGEYVSKHLINSFYHKLGLVDEADWIEYTFPYTIVKEEQKLTRFEHKYPKILPPFNTTGLTGDLMTPYLTVAVPEKPETNSVILAIGPKGGYVSQYWATSYTKEEQAPEARYWYINPFLFFRKALGIENYPIPDTTTLAGRRIFYSQIDGDAFISVSQIEKYQKKRTLCGEVILKEILLPNPDIPLSVSFIGADLNKEWVGTKKSQAIAKKIAALPFVELGSHTYSHPFDWPWFEKNHPKEEIQYSHLYPYGSWQSSYLSWLHAIYYSKIGKSSMHETGTGSRFVVPRAYANKPFALDLEIKGSCEEIEKFAPKGKEVVLYQWSGNCDPWSTPIQKTRELGLRNINGGNPIKDNENPSYTTVMSLGCHVGDQIQIYASNANENFYTEEWTTRFYGFQFVTETFKNTENPLRVKPIDLYYHFYSGEKLAALNALKYVLDYIRGEKLIHLWTSRYCDVADGFYATTITPLGEKRWQFSNVGGLGTIRFDPPFAKGLGLDFENSLGAIGQTHHRGSLYVYLDKAVKEPIIALNARLNATVPYLLESSWEIWDLKRAKTSLSFKTKGFGPLTMCWKMSLPGTYTLKTGEKEIAAETDNENLCYYNLDLPFNETVEIAIVQE